MTTFNVAKLKELLSSYGGIILVLIAVIGIMIAASVSLIIGMDFALSTNDPIERGLRMLALSVVIHAFFSKGNK